jgi:two-component system chemotaxis response regulator CheB
MQAIVAALDPSTSTAYFLVIHISAEAPGVLPAILMRCGPLPVSYAKDCEPIAGGHLYVAAPDHHLLLEPGRMRVTRGPRENSFRPAIDPLFRTAAHAYGPQVIGVVLSGGQNDGTLGLLAIKRAGGAAIVQDPADAAAPSMPQSAIRHVPVDVVAPASEIGARLMETTSKSGAPARAPDTASAPDRADVGSDALHGTERPPGILTPVTCPSCGGPLWERSERGVVQFTCHIGHSFTGESLVEQNGDAVEEAMWTALRSLEEGAALRERMAAHAARHGMEAIRTDYLEQAKTFADRAAIIRRALVLEDPLGTEGGAEDVKRVATRAKRAATK